FAPDLTAFIIAHETGHQLGLFHTTEYNGLDFDPLPDTPQCSQAPYDTDHDGLMFPEECVGLDANNLMFWLIDSQEQLRSPLLTPNQQFVILRNPVVSQPSPSQVHSVPLGSVAVDPFAISSPITVTVPQAAVSLDIVGVAEFTPAT